MDTILLVDDDPLVLSSLVRSLGAAGIEPHCAGSGDEALALFRCRPFRVLMTDQVMPGMTGLELIRHAHALRSGTSFILMSGHVDESLLRDEAGGTVPFQFVAKPWRIEALLAMLAELLARDDAGPESAATGAPVVDAANLREVVGGDREFLETLAASYHDEAPEVWDRLRGAVGAGDPEAVRAAAHRIKGLLLNVAAAGVAETARGIEDRARCGSVAGVERGLDALWRQLLAVGRELDLLAEE